MTGVALRLLGGFEARLPDGRAAGLPTRKAQALLAYLALQRGRGQSRDKLTALLWGDRADRQARHSLSQTLFSIRRALDGSGKTIIADAQAVALDAAAVQVDVAEFERLANESGHVALREAAALYTGSLLDGVALREEPFMEWLLLERERLRDVAASVFLRLLDAQCAAGEADEATATALRLVALDPLNEQVQRRLMRLYHDRGQFHAALQQYRAFADALRRELGVEPQPETASLYREIAERRRADRGSAGSEPPSSERPAAPAAPVEGERKPATVLCVSLLAAPAYETLDPEDAQALLEPVLNAVSDAVLRHGGVLHSSGATSITALFGVPVAQEDHGARACRAAVAILEALDRLQPGTDARRARIRLSACLDSGEVVMRPGKDGGDGPGEVFGLAIERAAQVAGAGLVDGVAATTATRSIAERAIRFKPLAPVSLGRNSTPVPLFAPVALRPRDHVLIHGASRHLTHLVGREAELDSMAAAVAPVERGHGQVLAVVGEAGVGKSRLLYELIHDRLPPGWRVLACRADSQHREVAYFSIVNLLKGYFGIADRGGREVVRQRIHDAVLALDPGLEPALPALLSLFVEIADADWTALEPMQKRRRTMEAIKALLHRESERQPLVLAIEDLHWLDAESQHVLDSLVAGLPATRHLLLVNYRPEYRHDWGSRAGYRQVRLDPLPTAGSRRLLDTLLGGDDSLQALKRRLIASAGGNPFFLEESVRALAASGALAGQRGRYRLVGEFESAAIPDTVQAVIAARLDRLHVLDKQVLQIAAVIGRDVRYDLLKAVVRVSGDELQDSLGRLQSSELLLQSRFMPDAEYSFKHALIHDVAYASLLNERRRELHARILAAMESQFADRLTEQVDRLAYHGLHGQVWEKAHLYARQAGHKATARSANRAALAAFETALLALTHLPETAAAVADTIDLHFASRDALFVLGDHEAIPAHLDQAECLAARSDDQRRLASILLYRSGWFWQSGQQTRAVETGERALRIAEALDDRELAALASYRLSTAHCSLGSFRRAAEAARAAVAALDNEAGRQLFRFGGLPYVFASSFGAWALAELGEFAAAERLGRESFRAAQEANHGYSITVSTFGLSHCYLLQGRFADAIEVLEAGLEQTRLYDLAATIPWLASRLSCGYAAIGRIDDALATIRLGSDPNAYAKGIQDGTWPVWAGRACLTAGRPGDAVQFGRNALQVARRREEKAIEARAHKLLGDAALQGASPDIAAAEGHLRTATALAEALFLRPLLAEIRLSVGAVRRQAGDDEGARTEFEAAAALARSLGMNGCEGRARDLLERAPA